MTNMAKFGEMIFSGLVGAIVLFIVSPLIVYIIFNAAAGNYLAAAIGLAIQGFILGLVHSDKIK